MRTPILFKVLLIWIWHWLSHSQTVLLKLRSTLIYSSVFCFKLLIDRLHCTFTLIFFWTATKIDEWLYCIQISQAIRSFTVNGIFYSPLALVLRCIFRVRCDARSHLKALLCLLPLHELLLFCVVVLSDSIDGFAVPAFELLNVLLELGKFLNELLLLPFPRQSGSDSPRVRPQCFPDCYLLHSIIKLQSLWHLPSVAFWCSLHQNPFLKSNNRIC